MENHCQSISSSYDDTIWIKSEVPSEFDSINEDLNCDEEIDIKVEHEEEIDSTSFHPKTEEDVDIKYNEKNETSKHTLRHKICTNYVFRFNLFRSSFCTFFI